jgi:hypothetical protein
VDDDDGASDDEDQLRPFGLHWDGSTQRTPGQRTRQVLLIAGIVVVAGGLIAGTLGFVVTRVQSGIGGIFPQPSATLTRFEHTAESMPDVATATDLSERQTEIFAGYDVVALVRAEDGLTDVRQKALVDALSDAAEADSGNGVAVYAQAQFGDLRVAVSPDRVLSERRLALAQQLAAMGGVVSVRCGWTVGSGRPIADTAARQAVEVDSSAPAAAVPALEAAVTAAAHAALPGARVTVTPAPPTG